MNFALYWVSKIRDKHVSLCSAQYSPKGLVGRRSNSLWVGDVNILLEDNLLRLSAVKLVDDLVHSIELITFCLMRSSRVPGPLEGNLGSHVHLLREMLVHAGQCQQPLEAAQKHTSGVDVTTNCCKIVDEPQGGRQDHDRPLPRIEGSDEGNGVEDGIESCIEVAVD